MRVIDVYPTDVTIVLEFTRTELKKIALALTDQVLEFRETENPGQEEAVNYLTKEFYPSIVKVLEGVPGDASGSND